MKRMSFHFGWYLFILLFVHTAISGDQANLKIIQLINRTGFDILSVKLSPAGTPGHISVLALIPLSESSEILIHLWLRYLLPACSNGNTEQGIFV